MSVFRYLSRKLPNKPLQLQFNNNLAVCVRFLNHSPMLYDGTSDPGPIFLKKEVQSLLKTLTRVDLAKVFRKRQSGEKSLEQPTYKFMTDEELEETLSEAKKKVDVLLQIPPILSVRKPRNKVISKDPALQGLEQSNLVFTDITYGVKDADRIILVRDPDGILKEADWDIRDRMNRMYFPVAHRYVEMPKMFQDDKLEDLLKREEYTFILDRACLQFEPNEQIFQKIVSVTYQQINDKSQFDILRSTRHFGGLAFFLTWHKMSDNLLLDLIETEYIDEASSLIDLYSKIHNVQLESSDLLTNIGIFINKYCHKKGALELALQAYRNKLRQKQEIEAGIKAAHGFS